MIIGFTGTRHGMTMDQYDAVHNLIHQQILYHDVELHHGDCVGADAEFHEIGMHYNLRIVIHPPLSPNLRAFCQGDLVLPEKEYTDRNTDIVLASDWMIAAPDSNQEKPFGGTWQTVRLSRKYNKPCKIVLTSGIVVEA